MVADAAQKQIDLENDDINNKFIKTSPNQTNSENVKFRIAQKTAQDYDANDLSDEK